jgi:hypothetical protein
MHNDQRTETPPAVDERVDEIAWAAVSAELDRSGWAMLGGVLSSEECGALAASYDEEALFRSRVVMARHGFGQGEYKYFLSGAGCVRDARIRSASSFTTPGDHS